MLGSWTKCDVSKLNHLEGLDFCVEPFLVAVLFATFGVGIPSQKLAHRRHLADYVLVWAGGHGDDMGKSPHLVLTPVELNSIHGMGEANI